ncbi:glutathione S-transferase-like [Macrosteles quadrilineatus]|uniref:glutathione S-transferase-like n=1 Tax=Macrosteles quadrilineatus TaxID=74068 RepID=UPI0023E0CA46|nr:glutathione S-transferase-like [Macrosteles quadrilineatus]
MAPKYKLYYFDIKGLAETLRFMLSYMDADWEDVRLPLGSEQWTALKPSMPFGKLPVLEEDGKQIPQSVATSRYLATKAGLDGKDAWENLQIDIIADTLQDVKQPIYAAWRETDAEKKKSGTETYIKETLPFYFKKLDETVKENGGYLANKKLSWVDFLFVTITDFLNFTTGLPDVTADYPNLHKLKQSILNLPKIQQWVAKRPKTDF